MHGQEGQAQQKLEQIIRLVLCHKLTLQSMVIIRIFGMRCIIPGSDLGFLDKKTISLKLER